MDKFFTEEAYSEMIGKLFVDFHLFRRQGLPRISQGSGIWSSSTSLPVIRTGITGSYI